MRAAARDALLLDAEPDFVRFALTFSDRGSLTLGDGDIAANRLRDRGPDRCDKPRLLAGHSLPADDRW